ncbi:MAG: hypothetical protein AAFV53_04620 [Myxococcota bacterium]
MRRTLRDLLVFFFALIGVGWIGGMTLPAEHYAIAQETFACSPTQMYRLLEPGAYMAWRDELWAVTFNDDGSFVEERRWGLDSTFSVTHERPPVKIVVARDPSDGWYGGQWSYTLHPKSGARQTELTIEETGQITSPPARLLFHYGFGTDGALYDMLDDLRRYIDFHGC